MKYVLINCYSDNNKGDLGIILSTIQFLRGEDSNSEITGISTYNESDPLYYSEHRILSEIIPVDPAVFGELNIGVLKNNFVKYLRFLFDTIRLFLFIILPKKYDLIVFNSNEKKSILKLIASDCIISKGGSFLCNEKNIREQLGFIRFSYIFFILIKYKKRYIIHCQSLGPIYGVIGKKILNYILSKSDKVILREDSCIDKYKYIIIPSEKKEILNDIAFFLIPEKTDFEVNPLKFNIGFTIKNVSEVNKSAYFEMIIDSIMHCVKNYNANIYIFPHVTIDNDIDSTLEIYKLLSDNLKTNVFVYSNDYTSSQLKYMYSKMNLFIGTRLHSTIFAMGENVPAICIAYHGTKAQGVFKNFDSQEFVIEKYNSDLLLKAIDKIITNKSEQIKLIKYTLNKDYNRFIDSFKNICQSNE